MAKNDNLTDFLTDVANAIREKKGTTDLINPQDFNAEIRKLAGLSAVEKVSHTNLSNYMTEIASTLREVEGSSALINPQDFADKIRAIQNNDETYTELSSLEGNGVDYIIIPYYCNIYDRMEIKFSNKGYPQLVCGALDSAMPVTILISQLSKGYIRWGNSSATLVGGIPGQNSGTGRICKLGMTSSSPYKNTEWRASSVIATLKTFSNEPSDICSTKPLHFFAANKMDSDEIDTRYFKGELYSVQIWDVRNPNVIKLDLIPVENSSGERGLYDKISKTFYGSSNPNGTGFR